MGIVFTEMLSCNKTYWDKYSILDQNMKSEYFGTFIMKILILRVIEENAYQKKYSP